MLAFRTVTYCTENEETPVNTLEIHHQAMAQSISTAPGVLFSADRRFTRHLRLNLGHPVTPQIKAALKLLGTLAKAQAHRNAQ